MATRSQLMDAHAQMVHTEAANLTVMPTAVMLFLKKKVACVLQAKLALLLTAAAVVQISNWKETSLTAAYVRLHKPVLFLSVTIQTARQMKLEHIRIAATVMRRKKVSILIVMILLAQREKLELLLIATRTVTPNRRVKAALARAVMDHTVLTEAAAQIIAMTPTLQTMVTRQNANIHMSAATNARMGMNLLDTRGRQDLTKDATTPYALPHKQKVHAQMIIATTHTRRITEIRPSVNTSMFVVTHVLTDMNLLDTRRTLAQMKDATTRYALPHKPKVNALTTPVTTFLPQTSASMANASTYTFAAMSAQTDMNLLATIQAVRLNMRDAMIPNASLLIPRVFAMTTRDVQIKQPQTMILTPGTTMEAAYMTANVRTTSALQ
jgi:hypothetical protein